MKSLAMYLPQFHRVPENDEWWGEGYTEWTAVKAAKALFDGHYQPHIPLYDNYYDLLQKSTMKWQAALMHKYSVDGLCFYHYYFKDGRKILEKPAENLLRWKDIDMPFCFSWANESWVRTWSKLSGNAWNVCTENDRKEHGNGVLLAQEYGGEKEWKDHFEYLLPFFNDPRYIREDKKPLFIIYKAEDIFCLSRMMSYWNELAKDNGIKGIYYLCVNTEIKGVDGCIIQPPNSSKIGEGLSVENYDTVCEKILATAMNSSEKSYLCALTSYDDTPRRGKSGFTITGANPKRFYDLLRKLFYISEKKNKEFVFINAWNEWGEGMHLEPDVKYGYGFLEAVKRAKNDYNSLSSATIGKLYSKGQNREGDDIVVTKEIQKYRSHYHILNKWMLIKEEGKTIASFFYDRHYKEVAIYGMGLLGKHILTELGDSNGIEVKYGIDQSKNSFDGLTIYRPNEDLPYADVIVVSPIDEYDSIIQNLNYTAEKIVSLEEVINYCL